MSRNPVNDNGLKKHIPESIQLWHRLDSKIKKFKEQQENCIKNIEAEYKSAKEQGYTDTEIKQVIGIIVIFSI